MPSTRTAAPIRSGSLGSTGSGFSPFGTPQKRHRLVQRQLKLRNFFLELDVPKSKHFYQIQLFL
jgi:hypothetical protein